MDTAPSFLVGTSFCFTGSDEFFIEHDLLIYEQEKFWINKVISLLEKESH